ncbi:MAG: ferritin [Candidatus Bathyarchaeota archaeon]|nr:MAG: ferritin [Candidatus Bathyarchaeota archaeon]
MVSERVLKELNQQVNEELYSEYIYLSMAADLVDKGFKGMATWMRVQAREEHVHAMIFYNFITERRAKVELDAIKMPPTTWDSPLTIFEAAHEHEKFITGRIDHMVKIALEENDNATYQMLQWFVEEQVEEEANTDEMATNLRIVGVDGQGILMIDREAGSRTFIVPQAPYYPAPGQQ